MQSRSGILVLGLAFLSSAALSAEDKVEVLARGPVHEAYAEPTEREPVPTPIVNKEPPKPIEELPPDQKPEGDNVQWIRLNGSSPLFQEGGQITVVAEGIVGFCDVDVKLFGPVQE